MIGKLNDRIEIIDPLSPRFQLYYFSNTTEAKVVKERRETVLTIDTRGSDVAEEHLVRREVTEEGEEGPEDDLEMAIRTK